MQLSENNRYETDSSSVKSSLIAPKRHRRQHVTIGIGMMNYTTRQEDGGFPQVTRKVLSPLNSQIQPVNTTLKQGVVEICVASNEFTTQTDLTAVGTAQRYQVGRLSGQVPGNQSDYQSGKLWKKTKKNTGRNKSLGVEVSNQRSRQIAHLDQRHQRRFNLLPELYKTSQGSSFKQTVMQSPSHYQPQFNRVADIESTQFDSQGEEDQSYLMQREHSKEASSTAQAQDYQQPHHLNYGTMDLTSDVFRTTNQTLGGSQAMSGRKQSGSHNNTEEADHEKVLEVDMGHHQDSRQHYQQLQPAGRQSDQNYSTFSSKFPAVVLNTQSTHELDTAGANDQQSVRNTSQVSYANEKSAYFKKIDSKVELGRDSIRNLHLLAGLHPSEDDQVRHVEATIQSMMRLHKTGVYAPTTKFRTIQAKDGSKKRVDTSLHSVKQAIAKNFQAKQQIGQRKQSHDMTSKEVSNTVPQKRTKSLQLNPSARVNHKRQPHPHDQVQAYDFGIAESEYAWKTKGANRLLYNLMEKDRFERMRVNGKLPEALLKEQQSNGMLEKAEDCTKHFSRMVEEFKDNSVDRRKRPTMQEDVPKPLEQKEIIIDRLKEKREDFEKIDQDMRQKQTLRTGQGPKVSKASLLKIMRDVDNQDKQKTLYGMNEQQLIIRRNIEHWIKLRKNAGMQMLDKLKDMDFAKQIFKAWDTGKKGYLTAKEVSEQLVGLGLSTDTNFVQRLLHTLRMDVVKRDSNPVDIEVMTLKDFLKVFNYDNFGHKACEIISKEFKNNLTAQLAKQRNIEQAYREAALQKNTDKLQTKKQGGRLASRSNQQQPRSPARMPRNGSQSSVEMSHAMRSQGSSESQKRQYLAGQTTATDLDEIMSSQFEEGRESMLSRDSVIPENVNMNINMLDMSRAPIGSETPSQVSQFENFTSSMNPKQQRSFRGIHLAQMVGAGSPSSPRAGANRRSTMGSTRSIVVNPDAKLSLSKADRKPTLPEKMEIINKWFASCTNGKNYKQADVAISEIADLLVSKQLVSDKDTGVKLILKNLNIREQDRDMSINYALFQRVFCRSVFKESLIEVLHEIEQGVYRKKKPQEMIQRSPTFRHSPTLRGRDMAASIGAGSAMAIVQELSRQSSNVSRISPLSTRRASLVKSDAVHARKLAEKEKKKKREKNLSLDIRNYQRKSMLNGIDQQEHLDENYDLVKQAQTQGVNPIAVGSFHGKEILDSLHDLKIEYDKQYFSRQTYKEFLVDPLGSKLIDAWAATDPDVIENTKRQKRLSQTIQTIAKISAIPEEQLALPSKKKQKAIEEEEKQREEHNGSLQGGREEVNVERHPVLEAPTSNPKFKLKLRH